MKVEVFKKKREIQMTLSAEELAKITGNGSVEAMMKKYDLTGMKGACEDAFTTKGVFVEYQKQP